MEEKKKSSGGKVILVIILLVAAFAGGFFVNKYYFTIDSNSIEATKTENEQNVEVKKTDLDINSVLVQRLYKMFRLDKACWMSVEGLNNDNKVRLRLAYDNLNEDRNSISCSEVGVEYKSSYCGEGSQYWSTNLTQAYTSSDHQKFLEVLEQEGWTKSLDANALKLKYQELFGLNANYKDEDFGLGHTTEISCFIMKYDDTKKIYAQYSCEGGGTCVGKTQDLVSAYKEGNNLFIKTKLSILNPVNENEIQEEKNVTYEFTYDEDVVNYVFVKLTQE